MPDGAHGVTRPAKVLTLPFSVILRPVNQRAVGAEGQLQHVVIVAGYDGLARTEAMVAIIGHAAIEAGTGRGLDKPFGLDFAVAEFGLPVRQAEFAYGLVIRVMPDAAVPINRFCCGAAGDERNGKQQNGGQ